MDFNPSPLSDNPELLRNLASNAGFSEGNILLHQFVIDNSHPNESGSASYINAVLLSMSDAPASAVNALNDRGYAALHLAVLKHNLRMVEKLLSCLANIDVDARCPWLDENTPLHMAAELGHSAIVRELLNKGASVDIRNALRQTALCLAAGLGHLDVMQLLVGRGADVDPVTLWGTTPLCHAGSLAAAEFLVNSGADVSDGTAREAILQAATSGNSDVAKYLLGLYVRFDVGSDPGASELLLSAVAWGSLSAVECLVGSGVGVNGRTGSGEIPLHSAVYAGSLEIAECLVRNGADVNAAGDYCRTPLHAAAFVDSSEMAAFLADCGADLEARDEFGMTPLHVATYWERFDVVKLLVSRGANRHAKNVHGTTPLQSALFCKNAEIAAFLSEQKADWTL